MSISSVAASIAALRQQPTPPAVRTAPAQPPAPHVRRPDVVTASTVAASQGELLNKLI